jgi:hypothetical protein
MAVREFQDEAGTSWRVWCITPEAIHPVTRAEDYLADCYQLGWLVFEAKSGGQKRRLCPYPAEWESASQAELRGFLAQSELVPARKLARDRGTVSEATPLPATSEPAAALESLEHAMEERADLTDLTVIRTFRYPGGRIWSAAIAPHSDIAIGPVLRFTAGARSIDLPRWPGDWPDLPDEQLVDLLRRAGEREPTTFTADTPRRRYNDPPA